MTAFSDLVGKTITKIRNSDDEITFYTDGGDYKMYHYQGCCEGVYVESIVGDLEDILNSPVIIAEEVESNDSFDPTQEYESFTWTFYKIDTAKGGVTIRWLGTSNGYYSESVSFVKVGE